MGIRQRDKNAANVDLIFDEIDRLRNDVNSNATAMGGLNTGGNQVGAALPASTFIVASRVKSRGVFPTMAFFIAPSTTSFKAFIIPVAENKDKTPGDSVSAQDLQRARDAVLEFEWEDISDEERKAGAITREFGIALDFSTRYGVVRTVAKNEDGLISIVKNPTDSPYTVLPFPYVRGSTNGVTADGAPVCFLTVDKNGQGGNPSSCGGVDVAVSTPRPHPTQYVKSSKITSRGTKPTFKIVVSKNATSVRSRLIQTDEIIAGPTPDYSKSISYRWDVTPESLSDEAFTGKGTDERVFTGEFGHNLDAGEEYQTIRIVVEGTNVGGSGIDEIRNPSDMAAPIANGTFTAGTSAANTSDLLLPGVPFVSSALDANNKPVGYVLKGRGVKAKMNFKILENTRILSARIAADADFSTDQNTLSDTWDDITDAERTAKACTRQFGPTLDFLTTYRLKRIISEDANQEKVRSNQALPAAQATFNTPDSEGVFGPTGGALAFVGITNRRTTKRGGVKATMSINIPRGTQTVTAKIGRTADNSVANPTQAQIDDARAKVIEYTFEEITETERTAGNIKREFGELLDPETDYGVIRLIAIGDNVNAGGQGGNSPDVFRSPKAQPVPPFTYLATFSTQASIAFPNTTVPAIPREGDVTSTLIDDNAVSVVRIFASELRLQVGAPTFEQVGAAGAFAKVRRVTDAVGVEPIEAGSVLSEVDLQRTFIDAEIPDTKFGKQYELKRFILTNGADKAVSIGSDFFRAGGEIDLNLLTTQPNGSKVRIISASMFSATESLFIFRYTEPATLVLIKNYEFQKDIQGKTGGYREVDQIKLLENQANFTPGNHDIPVIVTHPPNSDIRVKVILRAVKGGSPVTVEGIFPENGSYVNTGDLPAATDAGKPQYSARAPNLRGKFRAMGFKFGFTLPDLNMTTFAGVRVMIRFEANPAFAIGGDNTANFQKLQIYYLNPRTLDFLPGVAFDIEPPVDSTIFADIGQSSDAFFDCDRPDADINGPDFPSTIGNALRNAFNARNNPGNPGNPSLAFNMQFIVYVFNRFSTGQQLQIADQNALRIASTKINFPFAGMTATA